ncbi:hypothetical protein Ahy_A02g005617 [Arachis hypogaea]|uniref:Uncharacterized protein n=1 Tax=Arachis hypogaea TaxID=3818 RepID=A0A445E7E5_ARAHY|nr:hypothetical protein Ahy_A02g005617 [Arachis hypogaea]
MRNLPATLTRSFHPLSINRNSSLFFFSSTNHLRFLQPSRSATSTFSNSIQCAVRFRPCIDIHKEGKYAIVTDRWQKFSDVSLDAEVMQFLANFADEFLVHGVDVEGKKLGIDEELVALLGKHSPIPVTYAGGVTVMDDLERIKTAGMERVDVTVGSALDIFGGNMAYKDVVAWHTQQQASIV